MKKAVIALVALLLCFLPHVSASDGVWSDTYDQDGGVYTIYHTVELDGYYYQATAILEIASEKGANCSVVPSTLIFSHGETEKEVVIEAKYPPHLYSDEDDVLTLSGTVSKTLGVTSSLVPTNFIVDIPPYYGLNITTAQKEYTFRGGAAGDCTMRVINAGNTADIFQFSVGNIQELENEGWDISIPEPVNILPAFSTEITLTVHPPNKEAEAVMVVWVESLGSEGKTNSSLILNIRSEGMELGEIISSPLFLAGLAGATVATSVGVWLRRQRK